MVLNPSSRGLAMVALERDDLDEYRVTIPEDVRATLPYREGQLRTLRFFATRTLTGAPAARLVDRGATLVAAVRSSRRARLQVVVAVILFASLLLGLFALGRAALPLLR